MSAPAARSPLAHRGVLEAGDDVRLAERPFLGLWTLRGEVTLVGRAVREVTGLDLPPAVRTTAQGQGIALLWLGPDEWLLVGAEGRVAAAARSLEDALAGIHHQLVELSDYYTAIDIRGARARELLAKPIAIDLHHRHFRAGEMVATRLAKATVWLWATADEEGGGVPAFTLFVRASMADYAWCLLADAGREWGLPVERPLGKVELHIP